MNDQGIGQIENAAGLREWINSKNRYYDYPSEKLRFIGVVGANEKNATIEIMAHILESDGVAVDIKSTSELFYNTADEENIFSVIEGYFEYLQKQVQKKKDVIIFQVGRDFIKFYPLLQIPFDVFMDKALEPDTLNIFEELKKEIDDKRGVINFLPMDSMIVVNMDHFNPMDFLEVLKDRMVITYGLSAKATVTASSIETTPFLKFYCCIQRGITTKSGMEIEPMEFPLALNGAEKYNVYSILAATTGAMVFGISSETIASVLSVYPGGNKKRENEKKTYISY